MKGLMRKHFYMILGYCRSFFLLMAVCLTMGWMDEGSAFMTYYPCILASVVATTLLGYDEREKWDVYSATMPYTHGQIVSGYYLTGLIVSALVVAVSLMIRLLAGSVPETLGSLGTGMVAMSLLPSAVLLPFLFWLGAEKGRLIYSVVLGVFVAALTIGQSLLGGFQAGIPLQLGLCLIAAAAYAASWLLAIWLYGRRE